MRSTHTHPTPASLGLSPLVLGCLAATWFVWGSTYLIIRVALAGFAPFMLMSTRFIAAGGLLLVWQLARGARLPGALELVALALGVTVGGEVVTPWEWGSASVILAGVVLLFLSRARSSPG